MGKEPSTRKHPNRRVSGTRCWRQHHRCKMCPDGHILHVWLDGEGTNTKSTPKWAHFGVRRLVASKNIKQTRQGGETLPVVSKKDKQTRRRGFPPSSRKI